MNIRTGLDLLGVLVEPRREDEDLAEYRDRLIRVASEVLNRSFLREEDRVKWQRAREIELQGRTGDNSLQLRPMLATEFDDARFTYEDLQARTKTFRWPEPEARGEPPRFGEAVVHRTGVANPDALKPYLQDKRVHLQPGYVATEDKLWYVYDEAKVAAQQVPPGTQETVLLPWHLASDHAHVAEVVDEDIIELTAEDGHKHVLDANGNQMGFDGDYPHTHEVTPFEPTGPVFAYIHPTAPSTAEENAAPGHPFYTSENLLSNPSFESPLASSDWDYADCNRNAGDTTHSTYTVQFDAVDGYISYDSFPSLSASSPRVAQFVLQARGGILEFYIETSEGRTSRTRDTPRPGGQWTQVTITRSLKPGETIEEVGVIAPVAGGPRIDELQCSVRPIPSSAQDSFAGGVSAFEVPLLEPQVVDTSATPSGTDHEHQALVAPEPYWRGDYILPGEDHVHVVEDHVVQPADGHNHVIAPPAPPPVRPLYPVLARVEDEEVTSPTLNPYTLELSVEKGWTIGRVPGGIPGQIVFGFPEGDKLSLPPRNPGGYGLSPERPPDHIHMEVVQNNAGYPFQANVRVEDEYTGGIPDMPVRVEWTRNSTAHAAEYITDQHGSVFVEIPTGATQSQLSITIIAGPLHDAQLISLIDPGTFSGYGFNYGNPTSP